MNGRWDGSTLDVVSFRAGGRHFGIPVAQVERVFHVAEIAPLSGAPIPIRGIVNIHGTVAPVVDLRRRFEERWTELRLSQRLVAIRTPQRPLALLADEVDGVRHIAEAALADMQALLPGAGVVTTIATTDEGLVYIYDVDALLSATEEAALAAAMPHG
jgi:purine-binding chemotaxis protein CheW